MLKAVLPPRLLIWLALGTAVFFTLIFTIINISSPKKYPGCSPKNFRDYLDPSQTAAIWQDQNISPLLGLKNKLPVDKQKILGIESQDKTIEINLSQKKLIARQGDKIILETAINTGKYLNSPQGDFSISHKYLSVDLSGGSHLNQTYFYLPNVPYALYFKPEFAIIGSYWSKSFGQESGFGCIEVPLDQAETLYYWADSPTLSSSPGTKIVIHP